MSVFSVYDYIGRAKSDSEAVRLCMADAEKAPERTIVFSGREYILSEAVLVPSNTTVVVENCTLTLADEVFDNLFRGNNVIPDPDDPYGLPLSVEKTENIRILGKGNAVLRGPAKHKIGYHPVLGEEQPMTGDFWGWRTLLVSLSRCTGFEISGFHIERTMCWALSFDLCRGGYIHDIDFLTDVKNGDGIDFRFGCHDCTVERITGTTSDDTVACTAIRHPEDRFPMGNYLYPHEPGRCVPTLMQDERDISHITIRDVKTDGLHHGVICLAACGCRVHHITIENITEPPSEYPREAVLKIYTGYGSGYTAGDLHDISVKNIHAVHARYAAFCKAQVKNVTLENITHANAEKATRLDFPEGITLI